MCCILKMQHHIESLTYHLKVLCYGHPGKPHFIEGQAGFTGV